MVVRSDSVMFQIQILILSSSLGIPDMTRG
jgi:hypothetical protein